MEDRKNVIINRNAVTLNKANEIARKYYSPENIILVIVGNQKNSKSHCGKSKNSQSHCGE